MRIQIKTALRYLLRAFGVLVAVFIALALLMVIVNGFDRRESAQARLLSKSPPNRLADGLNIYVSLAQFYAPPDGSDAARAPLPWRGDTAFCDLGKPSFWHRAASHRDEIRRLSADNRELLRRYAALQLDTGYTVTARLGAPLSILAWPVAARCVFLANLALEAQRGGVEAASAALTGLSADMAIWRHVRDGDGTLMASMMALAWLREDYLLMADLVADRNTVLPSSDVVDRMLAAGDRDWDISNAFAAEFRFQSAFTRRTIAESPRKSWSDALGLHFFKVQATINLEATTMSELQTLARTPPARFEESMKRFDAAHPNPSLARSPVYNPIGKILAQIAAPAYTSYVIQSHELAANERMCALAWQIRRQQIKAENIPAFMRAHPELATDPNDGHVFVWLPNKGELALHPKYRGVREFFVPVGRS